MLHLTASAKEILKIPTLLCLYQRDGVLAQTTQKKLSMLTYPEQKQSQHEHTTVPAAG